MATTWADLSLSVAQRTALDGFAALGAQVQAAQTQAARDAIVPTDTYSHAKTAQSATLDLRNLMAVTWVGISHTLNYYRKQALADFDAANP